MNERLQRVSRLRVWALHGIVLGTGAIHAWFQRFAMNADGMAYLDLADRYARGDLGAATNGMWSPLYPALLGLGMSALGVSGVGEIALAHGLNFLLFVAAYAAFLACARELDRVLASDPGSTPLSPLIVPGWGRQFALGALFLWATPGLVSLGFVVPDLLALILVLLTGRALLRIRRRGAGWLEHVGFGALLGLGYLSRTALLPLAPCWLLALYAASSGRPRRLVYLAWSAGGLALVSLPLIVTISLAKERPTLGDAGRLNYAWLVNGPRVVGPMSKAAGVRLVHPVRQPLSEPPVYEFAHPVAGTYPVWTDPSYWQDGLTGHFDARAQWRVFRRHLNRYVIIFAPALAAGLALVVIIGKSGSWHTGKRIGLLLAPCTAGLILYALVHVERRYVAPFTLLASLAVLCALRARPYVEPARFLLALSVASGALVLGCGPVNFVCGTGTTTATMLAMAVLVLAAALLLRLYRSAAWRPVPLGCAIGLAGLASLHPAGTLVTALSVVLLAAMLTLPFAGEGNRLNGDWVIRGVAGWALMVLTLPLLGGTLSMAHASLRGERGPGYPAVAVARALERQGLRAGDQVASIGNSFQAYWARLAQVRIVAETPEADAGKFWSADSGGQGRALEAMRLAGARLVVADWRPELPTPHGWTRLNGDYVIRWLARPGSGDSVLARQVPPGL